MVDAWINCSNCGSRFGSFVEYCPKCGAKNIYQKGRKTGMGIGKKIGIGVGIAFGGFVMLGVIGLVLNPELVNNLAPSSNQEKTQSEPVGTIENKSQTQDTTSSLVANDEPSR